MSASDITAGTLDAGDISLSGDLTVYSSSGDPGGYLGHTSSTMDGSAGIHMESSGSEVRVTANGAAVEGAAGAYVVCAYNVKLEGNDAVNSSHAITVTSDRRAKENIKCGIEEYLPLLDAVKPSVFSLKKDPKHAKHFGFIAQEVESAAVNVGIPVEDFAMVSVDENGNYGLIYEEFIPLLIAEVQMLRKRLDAIEKGENNV